MRNLIMLLVRYGGLGLFLFLEAICLFLIVNYNQKQKEIWLNSSNIISGSILNFKSDIYQYYNLSDMADSLATDNARLKARLNNAQFVETILRDSIRQIDQQQQYSFIAARIVNKSINLHNNTFTIDRGSKHGIERHMGVLDSNPTGGIVGIVTNVSQHFSVVMSLLHQEASIPVLIKRNNYPGYLSWFPNDPKRINILDVPKHAYIEKHDTIITSTYSGLFPNDIPVAVIDTFWREAGSNFYTIEAELINDLASVGYVYVVDNLFKGELEALEKEANDVE